MSNKRKLGSQHDEDEEMVVEHKKKKKKYVQFIEEDDEEVSISQEIADFDIPVIRINLRNTRSKIWRPSIHTFLFLDTDNRQEVFF